VTYIRALLVRSIQGRLSSSILFLLCFVLTYTGCCIVFPRQWDFYDGFIAHLIGGIATNYQLTQFYIFGFFGIAPVFLWGQKLLPHLLVTGWVSLLMYLLSYTSMGLLLWQKINPRTWGNLFLVLGIVLVIIMPTLFSPSLTGNSFILCGVALLGAYFLYFESQSSFWRNVQLVVAFSFYTFSYFWRQESAMGASLIIGLFLLAYSKQKIKTALFLIPFAIAGAIVVYGGYQSLNEVPFLKKIEAPLFYVADGGMNAESFKGLSLRDSMKFRAVERFYINDEAEITEALVLEMVELKAKTTKQINYGSKIKEAFQKAQQTIFDHLYYLLLNALLLALYFSTKLTQRVLVIFFNISFWLIVFSLAYSVKLDDRHYVYLSQLYSFCNLFFLIEQNRMVFKKWSIAALLFIAVFTFFNEWSNAQQYRQNSQLLRLVETEINTIAKNKMLLLDGHSKAIFYGSPLQLHSFDSVSSIAYYDMGEMAIIPQYKEYLDSLCRCNSRSVESFYRNLSLMHDSVVVISTEERMNFLTAYLSIVHGKDLQTVKIISSNNEQLISKIAIDNPPLYYFSITGLD